MNNKPLVIIAGPTCAGKTDISIDIANKINGEVISADSMQVYKYMDIGSAKIRPEEMQGIKHYGIDILDPTDDYNVVTFQKIAKEAINKIYSKNKIPIIVGGTGFYIQSVLYDIDFTSSDDDMSYREELSNILLNDNGNKILHDMLKDIDPKSASIIHENNSKRVIRALEYYKKTGKPISLHNEEQMLKESPYNYAFFVITDDRETLYNRIDKRVDIMLDEGLLKEIELLKNMGLTKNNISMQGIGYKEILEYLCGEVSYDEAIYNLKINTRHFAKRQITWFKREKEAIWIDRSILKTKDNMIDEMVKILKNKEII